MKLGTIVCGRGSMLEIAIVSTGHDGDGERIGFSGFSVRATKRQASAQPVRSRSQPLA
jgi:hypothetical protein